MRKFLMFFIIFMTSIVLSGCSDTSSTLPNTQIWQNNDISITVPDTWQYMSDTEISKISGLVMIAKSTLLRNEFTSNISILKEPFSGGNTMSYYNLYLENLSKQPDFLMISDKELTLDANTNEKTHLLVYQSRSSQQVPLRKYIQIFVVVGGYAYVATITTTIDDDPARFISLLERTKIPSKNTIPPK